MLPGLVLPMCDGTIVKYLQNRNDQTAALKLDLVWEYSSLSTVLAVLNLTVNSKARSGCICRVLPTFQGHCPCGHSRGELIYRLVIYIHAKYFQASILMRDHTLSSWTLASPRLSNTATALLQVCMTGLDGWPLKSWILSKWRMWTKFPTPGKLTSMPLE